MLKILSWKPSFSNLADWHESSHCWCHTITRTRLQTFSVTGDVYFTLFVWVIKWWRVKLGNNFTRVLSKQTSPMTEKVRRRVWVIVWHQQCKDLCQSARFFWAFKRGKLLEFWQLLDWLTRVFTLLLLHSTVTRKSVIRWIIILRNFFCDILYVKKSHQNHAIHLKSLSDTLNLCYFECMFMWYEHVYDVVRMCI